MFYSHYRFVYILEVLNYGKFKGIVDTPKAIYIAF